MDSKIFMDYYSAIDVSGLLIKASTTDDDIGTTLRVHLLCERMIEAWICASAGNPLVFGDDNSQLSLECSTKIDMAKNFGLPDGLYRAIKAINSLRNELAHNPGKSGIPDSRMQSIAEKTNNHLNKIKETPIEKRFITIYAKTGEEIETVTMSSDNTKNRLKLCLLFGVIQESLMKEATSRHSGRWPNDFTQK